MCDTYADHDWSDRYVGQIATPGGRPLLKMQRTCSRCKKVIGYTQPGHEAPAYAHVHAVSPTIEEMA